ncbi:DNA polymerase III subunit delta [Oscillatoria sp. FACHB-1407]|uniref:DNA polymerase III subunit delta n=1 Tax=Oscillatoria sp. FACHB-1407 TaxID=2692847 RepID=UPI00168620EF|nr:DNA polymerase III subunit delta [Oscillatoria sp. FACHB-1407]MBD2459813.1 DNA polymerase III subunit delta [Oscillatoria sp. FACHB-1407]
MPIYLYWGDDDFALNRAVTALRDRTLDADWASFNYDKISPEQPNAVVQALNQAMTPPFGSGSRLVWLVDTTVCVRCSEDLLSELERTLPLIPETTVLLLTATNKPDGRIKSTKLLQKHAEIREFAAISPWKTDQLVTQVKQAAQEVGVKLTPTATQMLAEAVGNDTRQLFSELEKLRLYGGSGSQPLSEEAIATLVTASTQNSLQLADAIRQGNTARALTLISDLFRRNEVPLMIVKTLIGRFRTWLWIKLMTESGERDEREIARAAEINNPKQIYFLQKDVKSLSLEALSQTLPILLELESGLKQGANELELFQTKVIELCQTMRR